MNKLLVIFAFMLVSSLMVANAKPLRGATQDAAKPEPEVSPTQAPVDLKAEAADLSAIKLGDIKPVEEPHEGDSWDGKPHGGDFDDDKNDIAVGEPYGDYNYCHVE